MLRAYEDGDHEAIAEIYSRAVHEIASKDYSDEQCQAWAPRIPAVDHWKSCCERKRPIVAVLDSHVAGFLELDDDGHIDCAYVNPDYQRRRIMTQLVAHAVRICFEQELPRVYVEASICARPLFEKLGFRVVQDNPVEINGVGLQNFLMDLRNPGQEARSAG